MKTIYFLLHHSRLTMIASILIGIVSGVSSSALIVLIHAAISDGRRTSAMLWGFVATSLVVSLSRVGAQYMLVRLAQNSMAKMLDDICRQTIAAPLSRLEQIGQHRVLAALTQDLNTIVAGLTSIPMLFLHGSLLICSFVYLGFLSWIALVGVLAFTAISVLTFKLAMQRSSTYLMRARKNVDELFGHFRTLTGGVKELKLNQPRREAFLDLLGETARSYRRNNLVASTIVAGTGSLAHFQFFMLIGVLTFVLPGVIGLDLRVVSGYTLVLLYVLGSIDFLSNALPGLGRAGVALKKLEELGLSLASSITERGAAASRPLSTWSRIDLAGVTHQYHNERDGSSFQLGPVDLRVQRGEILFISGGNGSGKTTLIKLLTGLYTPVEGEIRVDGTRVTDENRDAYRQFFSAVFADFHLFPQLLGLDGAGLTERAQGYLVQLQLDHKVTVTGKTLSTIDLSQGQRRRLALLTAYLENRDIYVFDEWAADQDPTFKQLFYRQFLPELKRRHKAVIVISHDDRYFDVADCLIKLDSGQVVAEPLLAAGRPA